MDSWISLVISFLALLISGLTAWLTYFRKGKLLMTQPTLIFFGPDGYRFDSSKNKIYLRTLLYSTSARGQVLENLYVSVQRNETKQNFNIWVYGDRDKLNRGSGLFIPKEGVASNHHFLLPEDGSNFEFLEGKYSITIFAKLVGKKAPQKLTTVELYVNQSQAKSLLEPNTGIYFDWGPDQQSYQAYLEQRNSRPPVGLENLIDAMSQSSTPVKTTD